MSDGFPFPEYLENDMTFNYGFLPNYAPPLDLSGSFEPNRSDRVAGKVAIPRHAPPSSATPSGRVSRACENCREQKAKCSGHRPACHRCQDADVQCSYGDRKKEKMAKQLSYLSTQVDSLQALLQDLYHNLDASSAQQVDQRLRDLNLHTPRPPNLIPASLTPSDAPSQADVDSIAIHSGGVDYTEEDFNRADRVQAMGFVGEHSEIAWLYRLKRGLDYDGSSPIKETPEPPAISSLNYFQDDSEISLPDDVDLAHRPLQETADRLVENYFHTVHGAFPVIGKTIFLKQYRAFYSDPSLRPGKRWLAVLNLVFAIATRHALIIDQPQTDHGDHSVYFARAWKLSVSNDLLNHPDLQQTQVEGLAAFYLLSIGQVNRSWRTVGVAIRSAIAMGLNLRSETESVTHFSRELRYRVWWALFTLDTAICEITGRPPTTGHNFTTTPLPIPFVEEDFLDERVMQLVTDSGARSAFLTSLLSHTTASSQKDSVRINLSQTSSKGKQPQEPFGRQGLETLIPNSSLCFLYAVDLAHILRDAVNVIYAPRSTRQSWHDVEAAISSSNSHIDNWVSRLPLDLQFTTLDPGHHLVQQQTGLACRFYSAKLIILQPCLRRLSQRLEVSTPGGVCESMATICAQVAGKMLDLLPETGETTWLYSIAPWWTILHNVMQAMSILLTELLTRTVPGTVQAASIVAQITKAVAWLHRMSVRDQSSRRAWILCTDILARHGAGFEFGLTLARNFTPEALSCA